MTKAAIQVAAVVVAVFAAAAATNPGASVAVSQSGAAYIADVIVPIIEKNFSSISVPNVDFDKDTFKGGVTDIHCDDIKLSEGSVEFESGSAKLVIGGLSVKCSANYNYEEKIWPHLPKGSGSADISTSGASASVAVTLGANNKQPTVTVDSTSVNLGDLDIHFSGGLTSDLLNLLKSLFSGDIKSFIANEVKSELKTFIDNDANQILSHIALELPLPFPAPYNIAEVLFGLLDPPVMTTSYVGAQLQGEVVSTSHPTPPGFQPGPLPVVSSAGSHYAQMFLGEYLFDSGANVFFKAGVLHLTVTQGDLPSSVPIKLTTAGLAAIAPGMAKMYPNDAVQLYVHANSTPHFSASSDGVANASLALNIDFQPLTSSGPVTAFTLGGQLSTRFDATVNGSTGHQYIQGKLTFLGCPVTLKHSNVGTINELALLNGLLKFVLGGLLLDAANGFLARGIPLPAIHGVTLTNTALSFGDGYMFLGTDFTWNPN